MAAGSHSRYHAAVFVLGDLGRSPRMLNHAIALAADGASVSLIGYRESDLDAAAAQNPRIRVHEIRAVRRAPDTSSRLFFLIHTAWRTVWLGLHSLWLLLVATPRAKVILVQNPPGFPTLLVAWIASWLRGAALIVDWHNFGYSMLAMRLGDSHPVVLRAKSWERRFGRKADAHFCVSSAMRDRLVSEFGVKTPVVLFDKSRELSPLVPIASRADTARRLLAAEGIELPPGASLAVSPTSWTADEDMDLLIDGLRAWDSNASPASPSLLVLITGRGPSRESYEARLAALPWNHVIVRTAFLDPAVYRRLLAAAHFGLCLHRSSSGVDLPMKIIDLFGAFTPVCALDYGACLSEQIQPGVTAATFRNAGELAQRIGELLQGFPDRPRFLEQMQSNIARLCTETWQQTWDDRAAPVIHSLAGIAADRSPTP